MRASSLSFPENEAILDGHGNCLMPAMPIFQKHCFFKKCPKNLTNFGKFKFFFAFLVAILQGFSMVYHLFSSSQYFGLYRPKRKSRNGGYVSFLSRLYDYKRTINTTKLILWGCSLCLAPQSAGAAQKNFNLQPFRDCFSTPP